MAKPKINISSSTFSKLFDILSIAAILFTIAVSIRFYLIAPDVIPTHFGLSGQPDAWGSKATLFIAPGIATIMYFLFTIISRFPYLFNYPVKITKENAERQYSMAIDMLSLIKFSVIILFVFILFRLYNTAVGNEQLHSFIPFPIIFVMLSTIIVIIFIFRAKKLK